MAVLATPRPATARPDPLEGVPVVYFGNDWFAENRTSSHHVARRLAARMPVLYVDSPGLRAPRAGSGRDLRRLARKLAETIRPPRRLGEHFWHCTVPQLPWRKVPGIERLNEAFGLWAVRRAMRHVGFRRPISWFVVPHPGFMAGRLGERLCVYYCIDDYAAHPGVDTQRIAARDRALTAAADQLFVAPPALLESKRAENPTAQYSPHGVDVELFRAAMDPATPVPERARGLRRPVVGYFGSLAAWIDLELLEHLARARPEWTFLFVGHAHDDVSTLAALPNVVLAGAQPYESLPGWAKAFDVAIIPYRQNRQVRNANPLKLREYLATGRPVVSAPNEEIRKFSRWLRIASTPQEFLEAIEQSLAPEPAGAAEERIAAVTPWTWDRRVQEVLATVAARLESPNPKP